MNQNQLNDATAPRSVVQQQGRSPLRRLVPGRGWRRPHAQSPHVWEDESGNRVIVHSSINGITYRTAAGKTGFHYDHQEPLTSALRRNTSRKRAGLAAARVLMENADVEPPREGKPMVNNCLPLEMCLLSENDVPCAICPNANAKEKADDRLALTACSPLGIAVSGYLKNRLSLVESLGNVSFVYGQNGHAKAKEISEEVARIDVIVAALVSPQNDGTLPTEGAARKETDEHDR